MTYQTSRVVRQTHIPQGVIKRMSLSVLVDHTVRWEGAGAARRRILEPPAPETLKVIKDLVAAATGFNAERGDQLIVESLPFESSLNAEPPTGESPASKPKNQAPGPAWLELFQKNRALLLPVALGIALVLFLLGAVAARLRRTPRVQRPVETPLELPEAAASARMQIGNSPERRIGGEDEEAADQLESPTASLDAKVRELAQKDVDVAANIVRFWLQESESKTT